MNEKKEPGVWGLASASEMSSALRGVRIALSTQDAALKYTAGINLPLSAEPRDLAGLSDEEIYPGAGHALQACKQRVSTTGHGESIDIELRRGDAVDTFRVWVEPLNGNAGGVLSASVDISGQRAAEEHLRLALLELAHRSKNLLAVVLSIARQSADESLTVPQFSTRFVGRIRSLALAHDVLTDESWRGATVFSLVRSQLSAFGENAAAQSKVEGHNAYLRPNAVQYIGLALHELIAMSFLSGALSTEAGRVEVTSSLAPAEEGEGNDLILRWHETGIPAGAPADKSRFGHALLERIVPAALSGGASLDLTGARSLVYEIRVPGAQFF